MVEGCGHVHHAVDDDRRRLHRGDQIGLEHPGKMQPSDILSVDLGVGIEARLPIAALRVQEIRAVMLGFAEHLLRHGWPRKGPGRIVRFLSHAGTAAREQQRSRQQRQSCSSRHPMPRGQRDTGPMRAARMVRHGGTGARRNATAPCRSDPASSSIIDAFCTTPNRAPPIVNKSPRQISSRNASAVAIHGCARRQNMIVSSTTPGIFDQRPNRFDRGKPVGARRPAWARSPCQSRRFASVRVRSPDFQLSRSARRKTRASATPPSL